MVRNSSKCLQLNLTLFLQGISRYAEGSFRIVLQYKKYFNVFHIKKMKNLSVRAEKYISENLLFLNSLNINPALCNYFLGHSMISKTPIKATAPPTTSPRSGLSPSSHQPNKKLITMKNPPYTA